MNDPSALDQRSRADLIQEARQHGIERPERMTRAELKDEIIRRTVRSEEQAEARGLFGVARSMLASVVETGLNLPDAAAMIRGGAPFDARVRQQTPVATVTLAEIYAAQGHKKRALRMLDEVITQEPDHEVALRLRRELGSDAPPAEGAALATTATRWVETEGEEIQSAQPPEAAPVATEPVEEAPAAPESSESASSAAPEPSESAVETTPEETDAPAGEPAPAEAPSAPFVPDTFALPSEFPAVVEAQVSERGAEPSAPEAAAPDAERAVEVASAGREPLLVLVQSARGLELYWELSREALLRSGIEPHEGHPAIRVVGFGPRGSSPSRGETTVALDADLVEVSGGRVELGDFGRPLVVRAAVGWELGDAFVPLAVGRSYDEWDDAAFTNDVNARVHAAFG